MKNAIPFAEIWALLFIPTALATVFVEERSGSPKGQIARFVAFLAIAMFLGVSTSLGMLLFPVAYLMMILILARHMMSAKKLVRAVSVVALITLLGTAVFGIQTAPPRSERPKPPHQNSQRAS